MMMTIMIINNNDNNYDSNANDDCDNDNKTSDFIFSMIRNWTGLSNLDKKKKRICTWNFVCCEGIFVYFMYMMESEKIC